ncbi:FIT family protein scs3 [Penicillium rolfsii]|nr:FIT family protein scs3 [Penicillium rolfsii]
MTTHTRPALSPAALLIYPATLLLGSLFSVISPVARATRESSSRLPKSTAPLAPSLAADLHLSENPVNYFARKNNIFNLYFVKIGWLWTTVAFISLLLFQPAYRASSSLSQAQQQTRVRRALQAFLRYAIATTVWYLMTQWFFGPAIIDRSFIITGGKCEEVMERAGNMESSGSPSVQVETLFSAAACKAAGGAWRGGHDLSGHVFMLVLTTALLAHEAVGARAFSAFSASTRSDGDSARERKASDPVVSGPMDLETGSGLARKWSLRLVWGVVGLGWWMLFMTAIWFHTWLEKVSHSSGLVIGICDSVFLSLIWI